MAKLTRRVSKFAAIVGGVVLAAAALSGCSSADEPGGGDATSDSLTIGSVVPTLENPFWQRYVAFQQEAADQLGFELVVVDGQNDGTKMLNGAKDLIARGVDGLIHVGYYDTGRAVIKAAAEADIPVAIADSSPADIEPQTPGYENYIAFMGPNDVQAGQAEAQYIIDAAMEKGGDVKVFGLEGTLGTSVNEGRVEGLKNAIAESPGAELVGTQTGDFLRENALNVVTNVLQSNPDINVIWNANDDMAIGAIQAVTRDGLTPGTDILVGGMDLNGDAIDAIKADELLVSLGGHWLQGGFLAAIMYDSLNGFPVPADESTIKLDLLAVDKSNVETFESQFPDGQPTDYDFKSYSPVYDGDAPVTGYVLPPIG